MEELKKRKLEEFDEKLGTYTNEYSYVHKIPNYDKIQSFIESAIEEAWKGGEEHAARNAVEYMDEVDYENYLSKLKE